MFAVLGCVHGNLEALTAVLADATAHGATVAKIHADPALADFPGDRLLDVR